MSEAVAGRKGAAMLITRQELINECNPIIFKFDFDRNPEFEYRNEIYRLDQLSHLIRLTDIAAELKDYEICKIANNILAVYETSHNVNVYTHKPVLMHIELSDFCNSEFDIRIHVLNRFWNRILWRIWRIIFRIVSNKNQKYGCWNSIQPCTWNTIPHTSNHNPCCDIL